MSSPTTRPVFRSIRREHTGMSPALAVPPWIAHSALYNLTSAWVTLERRVIIAVLGKGNDVWGSRFDLPPWVWTEDPAPWRDLDAIAPPPEVYAAMLLAFPTGYPPAP